MDDINYKMEIIQLLGIPSIPKKEWDNKTSFDNGVAVIEDVMGNLNYACCSYDANEDKEGNVKIKKVFGSFPFNKVLNIYPVPVYMESDINKMDIPPSCKDAMEELLQEKEEIINENVKQAPIDTYEWGYDFIHNKKEAVAFLKSKNTRGRIPESEEVLKSKLKVMYYNEKKTKEKI